MSEPKRMSPERLAEIRHRDSKTADAWGGERRELVEAVSDGDIECVIEVLLERSKDHRKPTIEKLAADLIRRLAAAKASAENDLRAIKTLATQLEADIHSAHHQRHEAEAKLRGARGLALEEAAKVCEREATNRERAKPAKGIGRLPNDVSALHLLRVAKAIRALSNPE